MITLEVDEAYAFDFLSIMEVKKMAFNDEDSDSAYVVCAKSIKRQVGEELFNKILLSRQYFDLLAINSAQFDLLNHIRAGGEVSADRLDYLNRRRYKLKVDLQTKFFNSPVAERKTENVSRDDESK